jgi:hypothetical protein
MPTITFEQLPQVIENLFRKVENIERLLLERSNESLPEPDKWFDIVALSNYLPDKPAIPTIYGWVHTRTIPHHKGPKKLRFLKSEIDAWLKRGRRKTLTETAEEADNFIKKHKNL